MDIEELHKTIEGVGDAFDQFKSANLESQEALKGRLDGFELTLDELTEKSVALPGGYHGEAEKGIPQGVVDFLRKGAKDGLSVKGMATNVDADGGYTVVPTLDRTIIDTLAETNPILMHASRVTIDSNKYQRLYTVTGAASGRVAEKATRSETDSPTYALPEISLTMQYAFPQATEELIASSSFDIAAHVLREVVTAFDADLEAEMIGGDGVAPNQKGFITAADSADADGVRSFDSYQVLSSGTAGDFDYDNLVTLIQALPPRYRRNAKLFASTSAIELMRKLKDTNGMPLWRDADTTVTRPQGIIGYEVVEVPQMDAVGADSKSVAFGDMGLAYTFVSHDNGLQILRDPYTTPGYVKFYCRLLCGSGPMDTRALKVLQLSA